MRIELDVIGSRRIDRIPALIDTGFNGELCIPTSLAVTLGLELRAEALFLDFDTDEFRLERKAQPQSQP